MIENDYPIPSYMAEVFQKPEGEWLETPKPGQTESKWKQKIYAVDCEMVSCVCVIFLKLVLTLWIGFSF